MNTAEIIHNLAYYQNWYLFLWENHCFALTKAEWQEFIGLYLYFHVSSCSVCCKVSSLLTELLQNCWTFFEQTNLMMLIYCQGRMLWQLCSFFYIVLLLINSCHLDVFVALYCICCTLIMHNWTASVTSIMCVC